MPGETGQVNQGAAEIYEAFFVPALFQEWTEHLLDAARVRPGQRVLDVACGTGVLARAARVRVGVDGAVTGLDINEGMLGVAAQKAPSVEWHVGQAEALPFETNQFDAVMCQFGLMFFQDRPLALQEMFRVLRPNGLLAVAVWDSLDHTPGYAAVVDLLQRLFGDPVAQAMRAPFVLGDVQTLRSLFQAAHIPDVQITTHPGTARFPSVASWVFTDIKGWVLADLIDDDQFNLLLQEAEVALSPFVTPAGKVAFNSPAHIATAVKG